MQTVDSCGGVGMDKEKAIEEIIKRDKRLQKELKIAGYYEGRCVRLLFDGEEIHVAQPPLSHIPLPPNHVNCRCSLIE